MSTQTHAGARAARELAGEPASVGGGRDLVEARRRRRHRGAGRRLGDLGLRRRAARRQAPSSRALNAVNVHDAAALTAAIRAALDKLSPRPRRIALVLPDTVAKVSLIRFEKVPAKAQDLDQLIRWQVRKAAPFRIEDAQVSWVPGVALDGGGREFVVTVARKDLIAGYERACEAAGAHAGRRRSRQLQPDEHRPGGDARRRRATGCWSTSAPTTPRSRWCEGRTWCSSGTAARPGRRSSPTWSTRRRCITRTGWAAAVSRGSCWRARRCADRSRRTGSGAASRSASQSKVESLDFRTAVADSRPHQRRSGAARRAGAGARACCCASRRRDRSTSPVGVCQDDD